MTATTMVYRISASNATTATPALVERLAALIHDVQTDRLSLDRVLAGDDDWASEDHLTSEMLNSIERASADLDDFLRSL